MRRRRNRLGRRRRRVAVREVEELAVGDALEQRVRTLAEVAHLVPSDVRNLIGAPAHVGLGKRAHRAAEQAEARCRVAFRMLLARFVEQVEPQADAEERLAFRNGVEQRAREPQVAQRVRRIGERAHARQHDRARARDGLRVVGDALFCGEDGDEVQEDHDGADHHQCASVAGLGVLIVRAAGKRRQKGDEKAVDQDIAQGLENLLDVPQLAPFLAVAGHQGNQGIEGYLHEGQAHGVDQIIKDKDIHILQRLGKSAGHPEQEQHADGEGHAHPQQPYPRFSH